MHLALSSEAAPGASLAELLAACERRGLAGLEVASPEVLDEAVVWGSQGGGDEASAPPHDGVRVCAVYLDTLGRENPGRMARTAASLEAPVVIPAAAIHRDLLPSAAEQFAAADARLLLAHGSDARTVEALRWLIESESLADAVGLAWDVRPGVDDPARVPDVLDAGRELLEYVRMHGGGPESQAQTGMGIGSLMARLTLARFSGPLVLTPSNPRYHYAWSAWMGRGGGWGCGSKQSDASLVSLSTEPYSTRGVS